MLIQMRWLLARSDEREACRQIASLGGRFYFESGFPFTARVRFLLLCHSDVPERILRELVVFPHLEIAELSNTPVTPSVLGDLYSLQKLRYLLLARTDLGDDDVDSLLRFQHLDMLNVAETRLTRDGYARLTAGLPDCYIFHSRYGDWLRGSGADASGRWLERG